MTRVKKQAEQKNRERLHGEWHRREAQGNGDVRAESDEGGAADGINAAPDEGMDRGRGLGGGIADGRRVQVGWMGDVGHG